MTDPTNLHSRPSAPVANSNVVQKSANAAYSSMWWLTLFCLLLALGLVWWSLPENGIKITVTFPEGHGLQPGDQVLYRGIEVGLVEDVGLSNDLDAVKVLLRLKASSADLAREGSKFWIVRPQLSFSRITGLETAVGHKYVALAPGPADGPRKIQFEGLVDPPPIDYDKPGIEIVIRGDKRFSVSPGSTVTFRGVIAGRILSVGLSSDSRFVDIRAKIFEPFKKNLTTASRFWSTSGINFDFSLSDGLRFDSESLASIAQGGVTFLTIANDGKPISPGHVYRLNEKAEDDWFAAANSVSSTNIDLKGAISLKKQWKRKGLFGSRTLTELINGIPFLNDQGIASVILPVESVSFPEKAIDGSRTIYWTGQANGRVLDPASKAEPVESQPGLVVLDFPQISIEAVLKRPEFRQPEKIENALAVRANLSNSDITFLHYPLETAYVREDWSLPYFDGDAQVWAGAPVLSTDDGKVIGVLVFDDETTRIAPFNDSMLRKSK